MEKLLYQQNKTMEILARQPIFTQNGGEYGKIRPLSQREMTDLRLRLSFPEKFWKLANHYYNSRKSRMPEKGMEKLITLENQEERRQKFIKIVE